MSHMSLRFNLPAPILPCAPPIWGRAGHLQTLLGHILPSPTFDLAGEKIELEVAGGDKILAHFHKGTSDRIVYLFHGLGGYSHASYMQRSALVAQKLGHSIFMFNHRGCGEGSGLAREPYHSGRAEDLSAMIAYGRNRFPNKMHIAIGFSLSANALLLLAAGQRANVLPDAAIAVNAPINLARAGELLKNGFNRIYDLSFMIDARSAVRSRHHHEPKLKQLSIPLLATLTKFDDLYTAPYGGFKNRDEYYSTCSAAQYLPLIKIPTVIITAKDDPFVDFADYENASYSNLCTLHFERHGGHMGYLAERGTLPGTVRWLDYAIETYLQSLA